LAFAARSEERVALVPEFLRDDRLDSCPHPLVFRFQKTLHPVASGVVAEVEAKATLVRLIASPRHR
jgi:hypothetical protein